MIVILLVKICSSISHNFKKILITWWYRYGYPTGYTKTGYPTGYPDFGMLFQLANLYTHNISLIFSVQLEFRLDLVELDSYCLKRLCGFPRILKFWRLLFMRIEQMLPHSFFSIKRFLADWTWNRSLGMNAWNIKKEVGVNLVIFIKIFKIHIICRIYKE